MPSSPTANFDPNQRIITTESQSALTKLVYYAGLYAVTAGILKLAGFLFFVWLARALSVEEYATWGLLYALQTGLMTFALVGIVEATVGLLKVHREEEDQQRLFAAASGAFVFTLAASTVVALIVFGIFFDRADVDLMTICFVLVSGALLAYSSLQAQIVRLQEKHLASLCFNFLVPLSGLLGSVVFFYFERTVESFFWGAAAGLAVATIGLRAARVGFLGWSTKAETIHPIFLRVLPFVSIAFLGWLGGYGNNFFVKSFFGSSEVARYTFALTMSSILQLVATALNQVWSPRVYRLIQELPVEAIEKQNRRFFRAQAIVIGAFGGVVIAVFPSTIDMLGGNLIAYRSMGLELFLLFTAYVILIPWWHCHNYFLAYDKGPSVMRVILITSAIGIAAWLVLMWLMGPLGVYVGFLAQMLLRSVGITIAAKKSWPVQLSWDGVIAGVLITSLGFGVSMV